MKKTKKIKSPKRNDQKNNIDKSCITNEDSRKQELTSVNNHSNWDCTVLLVIFQTQRLCNTLNNIKDFPDNFTVITKESLRLQGRIGTDGKSRQSSKSRKRSTSKVSKKSHKTKAGSSKTTNKSKTPVSNTEIVKTDEYSSNELYYQLNEYIMNLKNRDMRSDITSNKNFTTVTKHTKAVKVKNVSLDSQSNKMFMTETQTSHRYIILSGFYDANIPEQLMTFGIHVKAIICVKEQHLIGNICDNNSSELVTGLDNKKKNAKKDNKYIDKKLNNDFLTILSDINKKNSDIKYLEINKDMLILNYIPSETDDQEVFKVNFIKIVKYIKYAWDSYEKYCETVCICEIPIEESSFNLDNANIYKTMISMVPLESISIPTVLHCMLEQIVWWNDRNFLGRSSSELDNLLYSPNALNTHTNIHSNNTVENITPILIDERNEARYNTFHLNLQEFDFEDISSGILMKSPIHCLWNCFFRPSEPRRKWYDYQIGKLQDCADNCFESKQIFINYLQDTVMNVLVSNTNHLMELCQHNDDENGIIEELDLSDIKIYDNTTTLLDKSSTFFNFPTDRNHLITIPKSKNLVDENKQLDFSFVQPKWQERREELVSDEKENPNLFYKENRLKKLESFLFCPEFSQLYEEISKLHEAGQLVDNMKDFVFIKEYNVSVLSQTLHQAFQSFLNVDYNYFAPTDSILLWFNNVTENQVGPITHNIETKLGFHDFYKYKLKGKFNFEEIVGLPTDNDVPGKDKKTFDAAFSSDKYEENLNEKQYECPSYAYNLGPLKMDITESSKYFFSRDSSYVSVKKMKYFHNELSVLVTVKKNNTILSYEYMPEASHSDLKIIIKLYNDIIVNCNLKWNKMSFNGSDCNKNENNDNSSRIIDEMNQQSTVPSDRTSSSNDQNLNKASRHSGCTTQQTTSDMDFFIYDHCKLDCTTSVTLPTGLLIEVVPTDSSFGPFYIRQSYQSKGPTCSNIWEEVQRCYLNNGTVMIFYLNGSVDILYSNGTSVKCNSFELTNSNNNVQGEDDVQENQEREILSTEKHKLKQYIKSESVVKQKQGPKNKINKHNKNNSELNTSNKEIKRIRSNVKNTPLQVNEDNLPLEDVPLRNKDKPLYNISHHSVLSWDGIYNEFINSNQTFHENRNSLKTAYDHVNQELYLLRNDGMSSLFNPESLTVSFLNGSKSTCFTRDETQLRIQEDDSKLEKSKSTTEHDFDIEQCNDFIFVETKYMLEHPNYATVTYNSSYTYVELEFPGSVRIKINKDKQFHINVNGNEDITLFNDHLKFDAHTLLNKLQKSTTTLHFENVESSTSICCQTIDSFGNVFSIDCQGTTNLLKNKRYDLQLLTSSYLQHPENIQRFFIFTRDFTGYEMIHKYQARNSNTGSADVIEVPLGRNNNLFKLYKQTPIYTNRSEQYLMNYKKTKSLPKLIKRKDLMNFKNDLSFWFNPKICTVTKQDTKDIRHFRQVPKAVMIVQMLRIKSNDIEIYSYFLNLLKIYIVMGREILNKYSNFYLMDKSKEIKNNEDNFEDIFGSNSYYLSNNLLPSIVNK